MPEYACRGCWRIYEWKFSTPLRCPSCQGDADWKRLPIVGETPPQIDAPLVPYDLTDADRVFLKVQRITSNTVTEDDCA